MRVLFVDDDQRLLRGLRRMLLSKKCGWNMTFAAGGQEALARMEEKPFDVIVADMRMPDMDGAELLEAVRQAHPGVVRVVLSGHSDREYIMKAIRPAHQFLSKPCSEEKLIAVVDRMFSLRDIFENSAIRELVTSLEILPVLPQSYDRLKAELDSEECSLDVVGDIVSRDAGLAANMLKIVNSSFFGVGLDLHTPLQAVDYLGLEVLRSLADDNVLYAPLDANGQGDHMAFDQLWRHSLHVARMAKAIADHEGNDPDVCDQCCVGGLLHDVGKLALARVLEGQYADVLAAARERNMPVLQVEKDLLGVAHAQVGGYLLGLWGFAPEVVQVVVNHNEPTRTEGNVALLAYVHAANAFEHELVRINDGYAPHPLDKEFLAVCGLAERADDWREVCRIVLERSEGA